MLLLIVADINPTTQPVPADLLSPEAKLTAVATGFGFTEGPVWFDDAGVSGGGYLVFSDIPADALKRWDEKSGVTTFRKPSHSINGNTRTRDGRLVSCEQDNRRVVITEKDGTIKTVADQFEGKQFNSPNDVVVCSDGSIWFTDPTYGLSRGQKREIDKQGVYRAAPDGSVKCVVDDFDMPNGLCFSPDEKRLYIDDSGKPHHIRVFDVDGSELKNGRVFCVIDKGVPDGIRCDQRGNVWSSAGDGVQIYSPEGKLLGKIPVPESPANLCFGGADGKTLFITARKSLYSIHVNVTAAAK